MEEVLSPDEHDDETQRIRSRLNQVTKNSPRTNMNTSGSGHLADENRYLNDELNRVETLLNLTRAEKDELSIRYNALSDRVSRAFSLRKTNRSSIDFIFFCLA